jgi:CDP-diacylglycerol--glycerol-3-phosphate 3-phosphatidyltransferase
VSAQYDVGRGPGDASAPTPDAVVGSGPLTPAPLLNIANVLTVLRIALVPVFLWALFADGGQETGWRLAAFGIFVVAAITDRIDGQLARKHGLVTEFGKMADPIADKALIGAREIGITLLRFAVLRHGVIPAGRGGKLKTLVQSVAIGVYVLPLPDAVIPAAMVLMIVAVALTVITGLDYVVQAVRPRVRTPHDGR